MTKYNIPPRFVEFLRSEIGGAVSQALGEANLLDLQKCREELQEALEQFRNSAQKSNTWEKIAELQGDKIETLTQTKAQVEAENAELRAEKVRLMAELSKVSRKP